MRFSPSHESEQNTRMAVLSTWCSWDISPMICGHSLDAATHQPHSRLADSSAVGSFITGKLHSSDRADSKCFTGFLWGGSYLDTFDQLSKVLITSSVLSSTSRKQKRESLSSRSSGGRHSTLLGWGPGHGRGRMLKRLLILIPGS